MVVLSFHCVGRVIGVTLLLPHTPCRSGLPSAVRGTFQPAGGSVEYLLADCAPSVATAATLTANENATRTGCRFLMRRSFAQLPAGVQWH